MGLFDFLFKKKEPGRDAAPPAEGNELEELLKKCAENEAPIEDLYKCLLSSEVYVLVSGDYDGGQSAPILMFNEKHVPIFSSEERIMDNGHIKSNGALYVKINAKVLFKSIENDHVLLNPFSKYAKEFTPAELKYLLYGEPSGVSVVVIPENTEMRIGIPAYYPDELAQALTEMFSAEPEIKKAFILLTQIEDEPTDFLVAVDYAGDLSAFVAKNSASLKAVLPKSMNIDFIALEHVKTHAVFSEAGEPFYVG